MEPREQITAYCEIVCNEIRWKKVKPMVTREIETHILDQRDAYTDQGDGEPMATQKAIAQMGDAISVGQELDATHRPKPQWMLLGFVGMFLAMGAVMNGYLKDMTDNYNQYHVVFYLLTFGIVGLCYHLDFTLLGKHPKKIYLGVFLAALVAISSITGRFQGVVVLSLLGSRVSLSYLCLLFSLAYALWVYSMRGRGAMGVLLSGAGYLPLAMVLMLVPTVIGLLIYTLSALAVLCFAILRGWFGSHIKEHLALVWVPVLGVLAGISLRISWIPSYAHSRLDVFFNPELDPLATGYLYHTVREILAQSVFYGKGTVSDIQYLLPNITTDYSLTYLIHEVGFVVFFVVTLLFLLFSILGIRKAVGEKSMLGSMVALSIMLVFLLQGCSYLIANLGYGLFSSLPLPFVSFGNTSMVINGALVGFMLSVFRTGDIASDDVQSYHGHIQHRVGYTDGTLTIRLRK
ncbi:FtsW/RodA/SpoVE family cell cycle protein [Bengtsoniella intestinalis]|uniref:FtsW/RodA/SpoVE family cell cycle protein n=1 Tax=Bengtsoniella intestinalis TaxID=3073143 RepID=UPI00391F6A44